MSDDEQESEGGEYEVERVIQAMVKYKKGAKIFWKYLVKWKGYPHDDNTWEPPENFANNRTLKVFWKQVDTEGRDIEDGRLFKIGEEFYATHLVTDVSEVESDKEEVKETPRTRGTKRKAEPAVKAESSVAGRRRNKAAPDTEETAPRSTRRGRKNEAVNGKRKAVEPSDAEPSEDDRPPPPLPRIRRKSEGRAATAAAAAAPISVGPSTRQARKRKSLVDSEPEAEALNESPSASTRSKHRDTDNDKGKGKAAPKRRKSMPERTRESSSESLPAVRPASKIKPRATASKTKAKPKTTAKPQVEPEAEVEPEPEPEADPVQEDAAVADAPSPAVQTLFGDYDEGEAEQGAAAALSPAAGASAEPATPEPTTPTRTSRMDAETKVGENKSAGRSARGRLAAKRGGDDELGTPGSPDGETNGSAPSTKATATYSPEAEPEEEAEEEEGEGLLSASIPVPEDTAIADAPSPQGGSLFSENEAEPAELSGAAALSRAGETRAERSARATRSQSSPASEPSTPAHAPGMDAETNLPVHRARAAKPLVKMIENKSVERSVRERLAAKRGGGDEPGSPGTPDGEINGGSLPSPSTSTATYRPSLLTFTKGKLKTERGKPVAVHAPPMLASASRSSTSTSTSAPTALDEIEADPDKQDDVDIPDSTADDDAMDVADAVANDTAEEGEIRENGIDEDSDMNDVFSGLDALPTRSALSVPPAGESLFQLAGFSAAIAAAEDLPEFESDADAETDHDVDALVSAEEGEVVETSTTNFSFGAPSGPLASATSGAWRQSTIFGPAIPMASKSTDSLTEAHTPATESTPFFPSKAAIPLRLGPSDIVQVVLKDVHPARFDGSLRLTDVLSGQLGGPPGKLFPIGVLDHVKTGGSSARLAPDESTTDSQRHSLQKLLDELQNDKLFIAAIGSHTLALCSSRSRQVGEKLGVFETLLGLADTVVISQVSIENHIAYAEFAFKAEDLRL